MKNLTTAVSTALLLALGGLLAVPAHAADTTPEAPAPEPNPLARAQEAIKAQRWPQAIAELKKLNATASADWNNLMGYALRKQRTPDLEGAQKHYDAALRIDPRHLGALEYAGELALMKNDLPTAEKHLATLEGLCSSPCEALDDLRSAVSRYKAGGNKS